MFVMVHGVPETACRWKKLEQAQISGALDVPVDSAMELAWWADRTMGECILDLYWSAAPNPSADWGDAWSPTAAPGPVHCPTDGPFADGGQSGAVAPMLGARHRLLEGVGHWWPRQAPQAAAALRDLVASVP